MAPAVEGEWASIEVCPEYRKQNLPSPGHPLEFLSGRSSQTAPQRQKSGVGFVLRTLPLHWASPLAACLTGAGLPPSPSDQHSVRTKTQMKMGAAEKFNTVEGKK